MTDFARSILLLTCLCGALAAAACTSDATEEAPEAAAETPAVEPDATDTVEPAVDLPEVVVLYGREELVPWLESENWWGEVDPEEALTVPHVIITGIHPSWSEYSQT